jgi:hypothetical protein
MTAGPLHDAARPRVPISDSVALHIANGFNLQQPEVLHDAQLVFGWGGGSSDDLLVWLEQRHSWTARTALLYLFSLHGALHSRFDF